MKKGSDRLRVGEKRPPMGGGRALPGGAHRAGVVEPSDIELHDRIYLVFEAPARGPGLRRMIDALFQTLQRGYHQKADISDIACQQYTAFNPGQFAACYGENQQCQRRQRHDPDIQRSDAGRDGDGV